MRVHAHAPAHTPICLHADKRARAVTPTCWNAWAHTRTHAHRFQTKAASVHFLTNIPLSSLHISSRGISQCCAASYCYLDTTQHSSKHPWPPQDFTHISSPSWVRLLLRTHGAASFAQRLLSGNIAARVNRLLVIFLQPHTAFREKQSLFWQRHSRQVVTLYSESILPLLYKEPLRLTSFSCCSPTYFVVMWLWYVPVILIQNASSEFKEKQNLFSKYFLLGSGTIREQASASEGHLQIWDETGHPLFSSLCFRNAKVPWNENMLGSSKNNFLTTWRQRKKLQTQQWHVLLSLSWCGERGSKTVANMHI